MEIKTPMWKVTVIEHDSWSGSEILESKLFDDDVEAEEFRASRDTRRGGPVPDYYIRAEIEKV